MSRQIRDALARFKVSDQLLCDEIGCTIEQMRSACAADAKENGEDASRVSRVTIYEDLKNMRKYFDVEIEKDPTKRPRIYRYKQGSRTINGTVIPSKDVSTIFDALDYLEGMSGFKDIRLSIDKVRKKLNAGESHRDQVMDFEYNNLLRGRDSIWKLYRHIVERNPLSIKYNPGFEKDTKPRHIQPYYLKQFNGRWYLLAWKYDHDGDTEGCLRNYAIDRINSIEVDTGRRRSGLIRGNDIDFKEYFSDIIGVTRYEDMKIERITIKCDLSSDGGKYDFGRLESKPIHTSQKS
ncbi:MAG: WYL domain-containing protein, partial [Bacteroidales bacterium]|nr:WYL domain-containing protein [Bacteroidales bacterium]